MERLAAVLVAVGLLLAGAAGAGILDDPPSVAVPRAGDRGVYATVTASWEGAGPDASPGRRTAFALQPDETVRDAYGRQRTAWPLRVAALGPDGDPVDASAAWVVARGEPPVAADLGPTSGRSWHYHASDGEAGHVHLPSRVHAYSTRSRPVQAAACGFLHPWQGRPLPVDETLPLGTCGPAEAGPEGRLRVVRRTGDDALGLALDASSEGVAVDGSPTYREAVPYPTRIRVEVTWPAVDGPDADGTPEALAAIPGWAAIEPLVRQAPDAARDVDGDGRVRLTAEVALAAFERGAGDAVPADAPGRWPPRRPDVDFAPAGRFGPPADGPTFAYPLDDALRALDRDPTVDDYHRWAADHPHRRLAVGMHETVETPGIRFEGWVLEVVGRDGTGWRLVSLKWIDVGAGPVQVGPVPSLPWINNNATRLAPDARAYPAPLDREVPTLSSGLDLWRDVAARRGVDRDPNWYLWRRTGDDVDYLVGWRNPDREMIDPADPTTYRYEVNASLVSLSPADGALRAWTRTDSRASTGTLASAVGPESGWDAADHRLERPAAPATADRSLPWAAAGLAALLVGAWAVVRWLGSLGLYSRIDDEDLLDHATRSRLFERIQASPAMTTTEVARRVDVPRSTARYHLRRLEDADLVAGREVAGERRWFPAEGWSPSEMTRAAVLATGRTRDVYDAIRRRPGCSLSDVAARAGIDPALAHRIVERLRDVGLVDKERDGARVALEAIDVDASG